MNSKFVVVFVGILFVVVNAQTDSTTVFPDGNGNGECGKNEVWNECGSPCPPKCGQFKRPVPCMTVCVPSCQCTRGFVRNAQGKCVSPMECPIKSRPFPEDPVGPQLPPIQ